MSEPPEVVWAPDDATVRRARVTAFARSLPPAYGLAEAGYDELYAWSVGRPNQFWAAVWDFFGVRSSAPYETVLADASMPGAQWFPGARLNYAEQVLRWASSRPDEPAVVSVGEGGRREVLTWSELARQVAAFAATLRRLGVGPGDAVVGYLPHRGEAVVALLGTAALGATWSACGQDYAAPAAAARLGQLDPVVLVTATGYRYAGRDRDTRTAVDELRAALPTLRATVVVDDGDLAGATRWADATSGDPPLGCAQVAFDHPLWVLYSSGTTGRPKGIVHGHGGVLLEHLKVLGLQMDLHPGETLFWQTSVSWMMWNFAVAALLVGGTLVAYDGSPTAPDAGALWRIVADERVTVFGASPGYLQACIDAGVVPRQAYDLSALRIVGSSGSTLPAATYRWSREGVGPHVPLFSISGGTDVVSAFAGGVPTVPVWAGELSVRYLGAAVDCFDPAGRPVREQVGELVLIAPLPSMPVAFVDDPDGTRLRAAYFEPWPGVWRHGDWVVLTERGSLAIHGRSDATLNRHGVRMGSADLYAVVEALDGVTEALVLGVELDNGGYWMPLFVTLADGADLDDGLRDRIAAAIRDRLSPRYVPDVIVSAPGIPHTRTGKKLEVPLKAMMQGRTPVLDPHSVDDAALLDWYAAARDRLLPH